MVVKLVRRSKKRELGIPGSVILILLLIIAFSLGYYGIITSLQSTQTQPQQNASINTITTPINITNTSTISTTPLTNVTNTSTIGK